MDKVKRELCRLLFESGCIKFGEFTLKSGVKSPIYVDLRLLVSYPKTLKKVVDVLAKKSFKIRFDRLAGTPYAGIPIATALSLKTNKPMVYTRKEKKEYGTRQDIEGTFVRGEKILVVDDLITTGESKLMIIEPLQENGLFVKDILVVLDREQGGAEFLKEKGFILHSAIKITELIGFLEKQSLVDKILLKKAKAFVKQNKVKA